MSKLEHLAVQTTALVKASLAPELLLPEDRLPEATEAPDTVFFAVAIFVLGAVFLDYIDFQL